LGLLACSLSAAVLAGEEKPAKDVELTGWIADQWCGAKNANAEGAACARECAKKGSPMVLVAEGGKTYTLSDREKALEHLGYPVVVSGTLQEDGVLKVRDIRKAEEKKA
jgi:hypothetical protein